LILLGDGKNNFKPLDHKTAGFFVNKDVKKNKLLFNKNQQLILIGNNNDDLQVFEFQK